MGSSNELTCFIAMPITTSNEDAERYGDPEHWSHVMESLFVPAITNAGLTPIRPIAEGSHLIHESIVNHLTNADMVLCDLSGHNPNVFFELGVRTSLNMPIALVRDEHATLPFDTSGINTYSYDSSLRGWEIVDAQRDLEAHVKSCVDSCGKENPLWRKFGLQITAQKPGSDESPRDARLDLLMERSAYLLEQAAQEQEMAAADRAEIELVRRSTERHLADEALVEMHRRGSQVEWRESRDEDPGALFLAALERFTNKQGIKFDVEYPTGSRTDVVLILDKEASGSAVAPRLRDLADRYGVKLRIRVKDPREERLRPLRPGPTPKQASRKTRAVD